MMDESKDVTPAELAPSEWLNRYGDFLFRYAIARLRDPEASEEAVQETFVAGLRNLKQYSGAGSEQAWLLGILKRKIIDVVRARQRTQSLGDDSADPSEALFDSGGKWSKQVRDSDFTALDSLDREEFWQILNKCMATLSARHADVFALREMDERTTEEICLQLNITASNLWVMLYRARVQLAGCMKRRWQLEVG